MRLKEEFDITEDRALRFTTLVRLLRGGEYGNVFGAHGSERHRECKTRLIDNLDKSLRKQPGDTVEQRWNNLMDELGCQERADEGVYLVPWEEHDADGWQNPGVTRSRQ